MKQAVIFGISILMLCSVAFAGNDTKSADKKFKVKGEYESAMQEYKKLLETAVNKVHNMNLQTR